MCWMIGMEVRQVLMSLVLLIHRTVRPMNALLVLYKVSNMTYSADTKKYKNVLVVNRYPV
jgi:hypothetical protein